MLFNILVLFSSIIVFAGAADAGMEKTEANLKSTVILLSEEIGIRSSADIEKLNRAADYIEERFRSSKRSRSMRRRRTHSPLKSLRMSRAL